MNKKIILFLMVLFLMQHVFSLLESNESIQASELVKQAELDIVEMQVRNISVLRANETLQEAIQLYSAQYALLLANRNAKFNLVMEYALDVGNIKQTAFRAKDELEVFVSFYESSSENLDLSEMEDFYSGILNSFQEERFEDTLVLIEEGYDILSEVQSSQTTLNLFYITTSRTIKNFFIKNWGKLLIGIGIILFLLAIFWTALRKLYLRRRLNYLLLRKRTIKNLIKSLQKSYFSYQKISEMEYHIRLKKFGELIRDINRQIPLLKEGVMKLTSSKKKIVKLNHKARFWFFRKKAKRNYIDRNGKFVSGEKIVARSVGEAIKKRLVKKKSLKKVAVKKKLEKKKKINIKKRSLKKKIAKRLKKRQ